MYIVYILFSPQFQRYYIGQTDDLRDRIRRHNKGKVKSTAQYKPWQLVHSENFETRSEAMRREKEIKKYKGGIPFKKLVGRWPKEL